MLHDVVVAVRIDADMRIKGSSEINDRGEDAVCVRLTGDAVDYPVRLVRKPGPFDVIIGRLRRGQQSKITDDTGGLMPGRAGIFYDIPAAPGDVGKEKVLPRKAGGGPLFIIAVHAHDSLGGFEDRP